MQVFISYGSDDQPVKKLLDELVVHLAKSCFEPWLDRLRLFPGDNWQLETGKGLKNSQAMVAVLSPESEKSQRQSQEISYAIGSKQFKDRLIPVVVRPTDRIPWILERIGVIRADKDPKSATPDVVRQLEKTAEVADR